MNKVFKLRKTFLTRRYDDYLISFTHTKRIKAIEKIYDVLTNTRIEFSDTRIDHHITRNTNSKGWQTLRS